MLLKCEKCGLESDNLEEVYYYDVNGYGPFSDYDIEQYYLDPEATAYM